MLFIDSHLNSNVGMIDFDSFQDNAFTSFGKSLIFKFSIKDFASETQTDVFPGMEIKFCAFFCTDAESEYQPPSLAIARVRFDRLTRRFQSKDSSVLEKLFEKEINMSSLINEIESEELIEKLLHTWSFSIIPHGTPFNQTKPFLVLNNIGFTVLSNGKVRVLIDAQEENGVISPCTSYGMCLKLRNKHDNHIPSYVSNIRCGTYNKKDDNPNATAITVNSPYELPVKLKQLYPPSWSSL